MGYEKFLLCQWHVCGEAKWQFFYPYQPIVFYRLIFAENYPLRCVVNSSALFSSKLCANWNKWLYVSQIVYIAYALLLRVSLLVILSIITCDELLHWYKTHNLIPFLYTPCKCIMFSQLLSIYLWDPCCIPCCTWNLEACNKVYHLCPGYQMKYKYVGKYWISVK